MLQSTQFLHVFQKAVYSKIARVVAMMVSRQFKTTIPYLQHIQLIYSLCTMSSFSIGLLTIYFSYFSKKKHEISSQKCRRFLRDTQEIILRVHKYSFILFNRQRTAASMIICNLKEQQIIDKVGFPQMILANTQLISTQFRFTKSYLAHRWKNLDFIFILLKSYSPNKVKKAHHIMTYSVASFYTQHPEM